MSLFPFINSKISFMHQHNIINTKRILCLISIWKFCLKKKTKKRERNLLLVSIFLYEHSVDPFLDGPNSKPTKWLSWATESRPILNRSVSSSSSIKASLNTELIETREPWHRIFITVGYQWKITVTPSNQTIREEEEEKKKSCRDCWYLMYTIFHSFPLLLFNPTSFPISLQVSVFHCWENVGKAIENIWISGFTPVWITWVQRRKWYLDYYYFFFCHSFSWQPNSE